MAELPLELVQLIAKDVEHTPSLLSLRLVSKAVNFVAAPLALRVVVVSDTPKSAEAVIFLQDCDQSITSLVKEVVFRGDPEQARTEEQGGEEGDEEEEEEGGGNRKGAQDRVFEAEQVPQAHKPAQEIFRTIAANPLPPSFVSMTLNNVLSIPDDLYLNADFHHVFALLRSLDISVLSSEGDEGSYFQDPLVEFWSASMSAIVRSATNLTTLTIRSDQLIGSCPVLSFNEVSIPQLASLTLHGFSLDPTDADAVEFIVRHKATLSRLALHGCSIDGGEDGTFTRPWHAVLEIFEKELVNLREFVFGSGESWADIEGEDGFKRDPRFGYTRLDPGWGYMRWREKLDTEDLDLPALESLLAVVEARRG
ncbi:Pribosyltran domain-containing protein [Mycena sanguinolenta]|uniref:Pribosyltran domain-containing protein n=1 Tax=Mycena sanguinolenta TaxID=230812 RepID=A0A8H6XNB2_9AGAR|nr:Pribosyltran domain-containing protein [Mycena sanguinolenta]